MLSEQPQPVRESNQRHRRWTRIEVIVPLAVVLVVAGTLLGYPLFRWRSHTPTPPPASVSNPPIHLVASNVQVARPPNSFGPEITFLVSDSPSSVKQYYSDLLSKEGWTVVQLSEPTDWLLFKYGDGPYYRVSVKATEVSPDQTRVTLVVETIPRID